MEIKITKKDLIEGALTFVGIVTAVYAFGKVIESNVDVEKNWQDYIDSKKQK